MSWGTLDLAATQLPPLLLLMVLSYYFSSTALMSMASYRFAPLTVAMPTPLTLVVDDPVYDALYLDALDDGARALAP